MFLRASNCHYLAEYYRERRFFLSFWAFHKTTLILTDARWGAWLRVSESEGEWVLDEHPVHGRLIERVEENGAS